MKECKNDPKNICGFQQSYIFNQCGFDFGNYDRAESTKQQFWVIGLLRRLEKENKVYRGERKRWKLYSEKKDEETTEDKFRLELKEIFQTKEVKEAFVNILKGLSFTHNNANTFLLGMHQLCLLYTIKKNLSVNVRDILINMLSIEDEKQYSCIKASENYKDILNNIFCQLRYPENTDLNLFDYKKAKATLDDFDNISKSLSSYDYHPFQLRLALLVLNEVYTATSFHLKNDNICEKVKKDISTFNKDLNLIISKYACPTLDSYINFDL